MSKTTSTILKIMRVVLIIISIICSIAVIGLVGKIETASDSMLAYYTKPVVGYCIGAVVSLILAKISDLVIKAWR